MYLSSKKGDWHFIRSYYTPPLKFVVRTRVGILMRNVFSQLRFVKITDTVHFFCSMWMYILGEVEHRALTDRPNIYSMVFVTTSFSSTTIVFNHLCRATRRRSFSKYHRPLRTKARSDLVNSIRWLADKYWIGVASSLVLRRRHTVPNNSYLFPINTQFSPSRVTLLFTTSSSPVSATIYCNCWLHGFNSCKRA